MKNRDGSWEKFEDYVIDFALDRIRADEKVALVTLTNIEGSSPRPLGAQMAVSQTGDWVGYLSGGCVERAVVAEALAALEEGKSRNVRYGRGSKYIDIQLPCGSAIDLFFDVNTTERSLASIDDKLADRLPMCMRVAPPTDSASLELVREYQPRRRLCVFGVGPGAVQLGKIGSCSGFETMLYSPDVETRTAAYQHGARVFPIDRWRGVPRFEADSWTAIAFMFHDHDWEEHLIPAALKTEAFYIGAMGSRRTHQRRLGLLEAQGCDPMSLSRIKGPAGRFAGSKSATDIAISILAEIIEVENSARNR